MQFNYSSSISTQSFTFDGSTLKFGKTPELENIIDNNAQFRIQFEPYNPYAKTLPPYYVIYTEVLTIVQDGYEFTINSTLGPVLLLGRTYTVDFKFINNSNELGGGGGGGGTGPTGPMGPTGPTGSNGPTGLDGPIGPLGATGPIGPIGLQGSTGIAGGIGPQGATGVVGGLGPQGATGPIGGIGVQGPTGIDGGIGVQGATGPIGGVGLQGPTGINGGIGSQGPTGPVGGIGLQGPTGIDGGIGSQGPTGVDGGVGPIGPTGAIGSNTLVGLTDTMLPSIVSGQLMNFDGSNWVSGLKSDYTKVVAPGVNDDSSGSYEIGSIWIDTVLQNAYMCVDASIGTAVWKIMT